MKGRIRKKYKERTIWIAVIAAILGIAAGSMMDSGNVTMWREEKIWFFFQNGIQSRTMIFLLPIVAVFSGSDWYLREKQSGFLKIYLVREDRRTYRREKMVQILYHTLWIWWMAAGFCMIFLGIFGTGEALYIGGKEDWNEIFLAFCLLAKVILISAVFSNFGAICGVLTNSIYLSMGIPFVCYYFLILLQERYFEHMIYLSPAKWMESRQNEIWILLAGGVFLSTAVYGIVLKKELREVK